MAAYQLRQDQTGGKLTLAPSLQSRLGSLGFGLLWLGVLAFFLFPNLRGERADWLEIILVLFFGFLPFVSAFLGSLVSNSIVIDREQRTIIRAKRFLGLPWQVTRYAFGDVQQIELKGYSPSQQQHTSKTWMVNAVLREGKRVPLNWLGTDTEMQALAQKISDFIGVRWSQSGIDLPPPLKKVMERIAPEEMKELDQAMQETSPAISTEDASPSAPAPVAPVAMNELDNALASTLADESTIEKPTQVNLDSLSIDALEKRIADSSTDSDARYALARKYHASGKLDQAIALYQDTMKIDPLNAEAQNDLGVAWQARNKRPEAESAYRRAIALDPFSFTAHLNLALLLSAMNRAVEASQEFNQARRNARGDEETRLAETASTGTKLSPRLSKLN